MTSDDIYYSGWTHRPYYPPKQNKAKRHQPDPDDPVNKHLAEQASSESTMVGA